MKIHLSHMCWLQLMVMIIVGGCKSVPTTSAIIHNENKRYDLAIKAARQGLQQNPNDAEAFFQLGISYSNLDSVELAYSNFMESARLDPNPQRKENVDNNVKHNYSKHYNAGQVAFQDKDFRQASAEFFLATEADPRQAVAFYNLGVTSSMMAEEDSSMHEQAIGVLEEGLKKATPDQSHYIKALGLIGKELVEVGRLDEAVAKFRRLVDEDPANYGVIEDVGIDRYKRQDWAGAEVFMKIAAEARIKIGAEDHKTYSNIGRVCYFQKDDDPDAISRSIENYERALDLAPDETQTIMNLIIAFMQAEDWKNAISWGEKYISLLPDSADGWRMLSISYSKYGDKDKASQCAEKYAELVPKQN
jgi:tetratricopeptide (TPR) repeat protein